MMMTVLITALFLTGAASAVAIMAATLRAYWPAVSALRGASAMSAQIQEVRVTTIAIDVRPVGQLLRGQFRRSALAPVRGLRAAA